jgi:hypothetical protein
MKIKINATNQTCPADVLAIFMGGRKIGEGLLRGFTTGEGDSIAYLQNVMVILCARG